MTIAVLAVSCITPLTIVVLVCLNAGMTFADILSSHNRSTRNTES